MTVDASHERPTSGRPRSGRQFAIGGHGYEASIASVGASLRSLRFGGPAAGGAAAGAGAGAGGGRDLVVPFDADELRPGYRGATLAPWPNRIVDGRYDFGGEQLQLPLTEPDRGQALHGLVAWLDFVPRSVEAERVVLVAVIEPQAGYPFRVEVEVEYAIGADGLTQRVTGRNLGEDAAPWGTGPHPYLVAGPGRVDDWTLTLPASAVLTVTPDRLSPVALEPVDGHPEFDFRVPRAIDDTFIDHAFTALSPDADGAYRVVLTAGGGLGGSGASGASGVEMVWGEGCPWVQVHTADTPHAPATHRIGLAVEPMTCAPDAFNSGAGLIVLAPGETTTAGWRIAAR